MNATVSVLAIMGSAVTILAGIITLTKALFNIALDIRGNRLATVENTRAIADLTSVMGGRITSDRGNQ